MNTDQGSQLTSFAWAGRQKRLGGRISMDRKEGSYWNDATTRPVLDEVES